MLLGMLGTTLTRIDMINYIILYVLVVIGLFVTADVVNTWEVANNYPYGKLCDVYNSCK